MSSKVLRNVAQANESLNLRVNDLTVDGTLTSSSILAFSGVAHRSNAIQAVTGGAGEVTIPFATAIYDTDSYTPDGTTYALPAEGGYEATTFLECTNTGVGATEVTLRLKRGAVTDVFLTKLYIPLGQTGTISLVHAFAAAAGQLADYYISISSTDDLTVEERSVNIKRLY